MANEQIYAGFLILFVIVIAGFSGVLFFQMSIAIDWLKELTKAISDQSLWVRLINEEKKDDR